ncbi:MAG: amidase [Micropruina sp.]|uniref:amidase n=1 Tax=Micropruina sp. TaxID=2737536 RepID=UPI0039E2C0C6
MLDAATYSALSALEIAREVNAGQLSAVEVAAAALELAEQRGPRHGAFTCLAPERAIADGERTDQRIAAGERLPLAGVPCPIKDLNQVAGLPWEAGSAALRGNRATVDDPIVGWFGEAGTSMVGKTTVPEFGLPCYTEPDTGAPARTPWDPTRSAGGSSGGAAAAVAAGIVPIAHGSDAGGSIRIPASACGLVGLKVSRGLISSGNRPPGPGLGTDGVLSRTVRDTALALDVLAGPRPGDSYWAPVALDGYLAACDRAPEPLTIGLLTTPVIAADAAVHAACLDAVARAGLLLEGLGHRVVDAPVPFPAERWQAFASVWSVGALGIPLPPEAESALTPLTRWLRETGRAASALEYAQALGAIQLLTQQVAQEWDGFDIVVTPTLAQPPAPVGSLRDDADPAGDFAAQTRFTPWTSVYNLTGRPAISLPLHTARVDGPESPELPIGVMLGGRFGAEETLLGLAAALESVAPWGRPTLG